MDAVTKFNISGIDIKPIHPGETYKYLGLEVGPAPRNREPGQAPATLIAELGSVKFLWATRVVIEEKRTKLCVFFFLLMAKYHHQVYTLIYTLVHISTLGTPVQCRV